MSDDATAAVSGLVRRGSIYTVATMVQLAAAAVVMPIVTRLLPIGEFGVISTLAPVTQAATVLVGLGLPAAATREYFSPDGQDRARRLAWWGMGLGALLTLGLGLAVAVGRVQIEAAGSTSEILLAVMLAWSGLVLGHAQALLRAQERPGWFAVVSLGAAAGGQALGLGAIFFFGREAGVYLAGLLAGGLIASWVGVFAAGTPHQWGLIRGELASGLRLGTPTVPHTLSLSILAVGDRLVIQQILNVNEAARYHVAYTVGAICLLVITAANSAWAPLYYGAKDDVRPEVLVRTTSAVQRLIPSLVGAICLGAPVAIRVLAPATFDPSELTSTSVLVAGAGWSYAVYLASGMVLFQFRRTTYLAIITPITALANLLLNVILVPIMGLAGAAIATLLGYSAQAAAIHVVASRIETHSWDRREALRSLVVVAILMAIALVLPSNGPWLWVRGVAAAVGLLAFVAEARCLARGGRPANAGTGSDPSPV